MRPDAGPALRFSAIGNGEIRVVGVATPVGIPVHERIRRRVVGVVPRRARNPIPVPIRINALDVWVVDLARDLDPLARGDDRPHPGSVVVIEERVDRMVWSLLLPPSLSR